MGSNAISYYIEIIYFREKASVKVVPNRSDPICVDRNLGFLYSSSMPSFQGQGVPGNSIMKVSQAAVDVAWKSGVAVVSGSGIISVGAVLGVSDFKSNQISRVWYTI